MDHQVASKNQKPELEDQLEAPVDKLVVLAKIQEVWETAV